MKDRPFSAPDPVNADAKEVYAFYGLAAFRAQHVEKGLVYFLTVLEVQGWEAAPKNYQAILSALESKTFGKLLEKAREKVSIEEQDENLLRDALKARNHLIHHFFAQNDEALGNETGRKAMIGALREMAVLFARAGAAVWKWYLPLLERAGISQDEVERLSAEEAAT